MINDVVEPFPQDTPQFEPIFRGELSMAFYNWSTSMSVGQPVLDSDHQALIALINDLHVAVGKCDQGQSIREILKQLYDYVNFHFRREEKVMSACGVEDTRAHLEEHSDFVRFVEENFSDDLAVLDPAAAHRLLEYLKEWLNSHILIIDMAYKPAVQNNPEADAAAALFGPGLAEVEPAKMP